MSQQISRVIDLDICSCSGSESESPVLRTSALQCDLKKWVGGGGSVVGRDGY